VILVDTSVWIDYFNNHQSLEAEFLTVCIAEARPIVLPGLVLAETLLGVRDSAHADRVTSVLQAFDLAPELERSDYQDAAAIYRECRARGSTLRSTIDCLIAQLSLRYDYELLTRDRDFDVISRYFPVRRITPAPGVQEQARLYYTPPPTSTPQPAAALSRRRAAAPRRSSPASAAHRRATQR
jgi:predicted nucleic acid-binding protein